MRSFDAPVQVVLELEGVRSRLPTEACAQWLNDAVRTGVLAKTRARVQPLYEPEVSTVVQVGGASGQSDRSTDWDRMRLLRAFRSSMTGRVHQLIVSWQTVKELGIPDGRCSVGLSLWSSPWSDQLVMHLSAWLSESASAKRVRRDDWDDAVVLAKDVFSSCRVEVFEWPSVQTSMQRFAAQVH